MSCWKMLSEGLQGRCTILHPHHALVVGITGNDLMPVSKHSGFRPSALQWIILKKFPYGSLKYVGGDNNTAKGYYYGNEGY